MKNKLFLLNFVLMRLTSFGQTNIVPNPGFENHTNCPDYPGQIHYSTGWNNVNMVTNTSTVGTPDYFHACGSASLGYNTVPPNTFDGVCTPHTGSGMAGTVLYNVPYPEYREYMSIQLTQTMVPGQTYTVSFWITNGNPPKSPFTIKNIGAHLSGSPLSQTGWNVINMAPTLEITNYSGSNGWVKYTFTVIPSSNLNYITVGSFRNDAANTPVSTYTGTSGPASSYAFYFWDDIEVWTPDNTTILNEIGHLSNFEIFPNPTNDLINISIPEFVDELALHNYLGDKIKTYKPETANQLNFAGLPRGIYFIKVYSQKRMVGYKKIILE